MTRVRAGLALAALAVLGIALVGLLRRGGGPAAGPGPSSAPAERTAEAPPEAVPGLRAAPPHPDAAAPPAGPAAGEPPPTASGEAGLLPRAGELTVVVEADPSVSESQEVTISVESLAQVLRWTEGSAVAEEARPALALGGSSGDVVARRRAGTGPSGERSAWTVGGLLPGRHVVRAHAPPTVEWRPAWVDLDAAGATVRLRAGGSHAFGVLEVQLRMGEAAVSGAVEVRARGVPWARLPLGTGAIPASVSVPAEEELEIEPTDWLDKPYRAGPAARSRRVAAEARVREVFSLGEGVPVRLALLAGGKQPNVYLWRVPTAGEAEYLGITKPVVNPDDSARVWLAPGRYAALLTDTGPRRPQAWTSFEVRGPGEETVDLAAPPESNVFRLRLETPAGDPLRDVRLWLGRLDDASPLGVVLADAVTGADGWATFPAVPSGDYLLAEFESLTWCDARVRAGADLTVVRGGRAAPPDPRAQEASLLGRVWEPSGRPMPDGHAWVRAEEAAWGSYTGISNGEFQFGGLPAGRLVVRIVPSWVRTGERHAPAEVRVTAAPGERRVVEIRLARP